MNLKQHFISSLLVTGLLGSTAINAFAETIGDYEIIARHAEIYYINQVRLDGGIDEVSPHISVTGKTLQLRGNVRFLGTNTVAPETKNRLVFPAYGRGTVSVDLYSGPASDPASELVGSGTWVLPDSPTNEYYSSSDVPKPPLAVDFRVRPQFNTTESSCSQMGQRMDCTLAIEGELAPDGTGINGMCSEFMTPLYAVVSVRGKLGYLLDHTGDAPLGNGITLSGRGHAEWQYVIVPYWQVTDTGPDGNC